MRYKRKLHTIHPITQGFIVQVFPSLHEGEDGIWCAEILGPDIDQVTFDSSPYGVMQMAADVVRILTGACTFSGAAVASEHDYSIKTVIGAETDEDPPIPALECSRCRQKTALYCFDEIAEKIDQVG